MVLTADQQNLRDFLRETIPLLCKSRLDFQSKFTVEAVIGLTIDDDDLFFVSLNENVSASAELHSKQAADDLMTQSMLPASTAQGSEEYHPKRKRKKVAQRKETPPIPSLTMSVDEGDIATNLESSEVGLGYIKTEVVDQHHESGLDESGLGAMPGMSSTLMDDSDDDDGGADDGDDYAVDDRSDDDDYKPTPTTATESEARTDDDYAGKELFRQKGSTLVCISCDICGKTFGSTTGLFSHKAMVHENKARHKCRICGKGYMSITPCRAHELSHIKLKEFKCDLCDSSYTTRQKLKIHTGTVHMESKPLACHKCAKPYVDRSDLNKHMRWCVQGHFYQCEMCGKEFRYRGTLTNHIKRHHPETDNTE